MEKIELFSQKSDCCACGACMNICPKKAITMAEDESGFKYPSINEALCIGCGACKNVCSYQNKQEDNKPADTYVAITQTTDITQSASGGVFAALAKYFIDIGGVVYGVSLESSDGELKPMHIGVEREEELPRLLGSKYVQSDVGYIYTQVKQQVLQGRNVLFSGTPCQVAGLKAFLGNKQYDNLLLIDIICHGIPSSKFFNSYIRELEKKLKGKIIDFKFRVKSDGWGYVAKAYYMAKGKELKAKRVYARESSYYHLFLEGAIYRENCYSCKYASEHRVGDITLGDYWGIEKEHPEYLAANGGSFDECKGISCMILNTEKGRKYTEQFKDRILYQESTFAKAAKHNGQLNHPTKRNEIRNDILEIYMKSGYGAIDKWFDKKTGWKKIPIYVMDRIPVSIKKGIRRLLK